MAKSKTRKPIPLHVVRELWARSAGRCAFEGCNKVLWRDARTKRSSNRGYIAHIVAAEPNFKRGDPVRSPLLCQDYDNLMLLCDDCHDRIDGEHTWHEYTEVRLRQMKQCHEARIERLSAICDDQASEILLYGANIGQHGSPLAVNDCSLAMTPHFFPANASPISLGMVNSSIQDDQDLYWQVEQQNLEQQFRRKVHDRITSGEIRHLSVFGLAPQPLLIHLGTLLGDIVPSVIYQRHREPATWSWRELNNPVVFHVNPPEHDYATVALNLSLSATITADRIQAVLGPECAIWTLTHEQPHNDFLRTSNQLADFRNVLRRLLDAVKARHGQDTRLHIFPAMPAAMAIELGRVRMPKADVAFALYDQNHRTSGFTSALTIN
ncbi:SAVED domain-containing protein [Fibrella aestuarina]|nr:SAVED domain-containing protein [Fibrella aestuarina]